MRRMMSTMLGLSLLMGSVALFADDAGKDTTKKVHEMDTSKHTKKGAKKKPKKKTTDTAR